MKKSCVLHAQCKPSKIFRVYMTYLEIMKKKQRLSLSPPPELASELDTGPLNAVIALYVRVAI